MTSPIARHRIQLGLSRAQLAAVLHVSTATMGSYERGETTPPPDVLAAISRLFTADCDSLRAELATYRADLTRRALATVQSAAAHLGNDEAGEVAEILFCDVYKKAVFRQTLPGSDVFRRVQKNQDERYHHLEEAPIGTSDGPSLPDLYLDFKKTFSVPTPRVLEALGGDGIERVAVVPPIWGHDLIHRFFGFHSRIAVPTD